MAQPAKFIYQIFYDDATREIAMANAPHGFIPLDNTANPRPDWYEFWVIREFLKTHTLDEDALYGFLSPQFTAKSDFAPDYVMRELDVHPDHDVALFTVGWEQLAYFQNPFEQGEMWHAGLRDLSQQFLDSIGLAVDLKTFVTHSLTSVFGNYILAKPVFWRAWLALADQFFDWVETSAHSAVQGHTTYGEAVNGIDRLAPMKTFIQERLASIVLSTNAFKTYAPDQTYTCRVVQSVFKDDAEQREKFRACNHLKALFCASGDAQHLADYRAMRASMVFLK